MLLQRIKGFGADDDPLVAFLFFSKPPQPLPCLRLLLEPCRVESQRGRDQASSLLRVSDRHQQTHSFLTGRKTRIALKMRDEVLVQFSGLLRGQEVPVVASVMARQGQGSLCREAFDLSKSGNVARGEG